MQEAAAERSNERVVMATGSRTAQSRSGCSSRSKEPRKLIVRDGEIGKQAFTNLARAGGPD